jgi:hypothetical protein
VVLLSALCWDYQAQDHESLAALNVFECIQNWNGKVENPLRRAWGNHVNLYTIEKAKQD